MLKKTKIICTVGPASSSKQTIEKMFQAGMNGARINTAYGNLDQYQSVIETVRQVADIPIIIDIKGPEIRIRASQQKVFRKGDILEVGFDGEEISFNHDFYDEMAVDDEVYIDNGKIRTRVVEKKERKLRLPTLDNGVIEDGKGVDRLHKMHLIDDEETVLFTAAMRTTMKHPSNSIKIHKIKELREFAFS